MKAFHLALALLLASGTIGALFLAGPAEIGKPFSILCEGKGNAFISLPDGTNRSLALNSSGQAEFTPQEAGAYAIRCGNETKTVVAQQAGDAISSLVLFSIMAFVALMAAASVYISKAILGGTMRFSKTVSGGKARLLLHADRDMELVEISDPVCFGHAGKSMGFSVPMLKKGAEWGFEYPIASPEKALPASLTAMVGGKEVSMLSELHIEDEGKIPAKQPRLESIQRKNKASKARR